MNIQQTSFNPSATQIRRLPQAPKSEAKQADNTVQNSDSVTLSDNSDVQDLKDAQYSKLYKKGKTAAIIGGALGTIGGVVAGMAGGAAGAIVGLAAAPLTSLAGAVTGAVVGFKSAKLMTDSIDGARFLGILTGGVGLVAGCAAGFYGGALLGAAAGAGGGALGALAGAIGGATVGGVAGGGGKMSYELKANKDQYSEVLKDIASEKNAKDNPKGSELL